MRQFVYLGEDKAGERCCSALEMEERLVVGDLFNPFIRRELHVDEIRAARKAASLLAFSMIFFASSSTFSFSRNRGRAMVKSAPFFPQSTPW